MMSVLFIELFAYFCGNVWLWQARLLLMPMGIRSRFDMEGLLDPELDENPEYRPLSGTLGALSQSRFQLPRIRGN